MALPKLTRLELQIMDTLWSKGPCSIRELLEAFPKDERLAYTTVQTVVYRLEAKKAIRRTSKFGNAHVFEAMVSRDSAQHRMIDDLVALFGGRRLPIVTHLIESGKLTPEELREARAALRKATKHGEAGMIPSSFLPIANHLWQSTLFAGIAGLLTLLLRNNRAHARYCLWLAASAKFLVPFSLLMLVGGLVGRHSVVLPAPTRVPVIVEQMNEPFVAEVPPGAVAMLHASKSGTWVVPILVALWAIGCGALVFSWWVRWRRIRVAVRAASPVPLGIGVPALSSASIIEPGVFGVFRPVLLLPDGIGDRLAPAELQAILAHELCHVRRRDNLATLMHMVVEAVFWFHPLVWWLGARLMDERERACDEEVLRRGSEAEAYAEGILKVCELYLQSPLKCVAGVTGANLKKRIEAIMANRPMLNLNLPKKVGLMLAGILAVAIPVILGITNAPELRAQAQSVPKQDITGTWQGKLPVPQAPNGELRIVFKILKADEGALKATFYIIDRPVPGLPASAVAIQGSNVTITIPGIGGIYEGKLDADAITLTGKWTAGGMPMPLTLAHVKDDASWEIPKPPPAPKMMAADADPVFEVASIKPSDPNRRGGDCSL